MMRRPKPTQLFENVVQKTLVNAPKHPISRTSILGSFSPLYARSDREKWTWRLTICLIGIAQRCYRHSLFPAASFAYRAAIRLSPARQEELLAPLSKSEARRRRFDRAFACFLRQCDLPAAPHADIKRAMMPVVARCAEPLGSICAITSVMPRRIEVQQAALRSWRAAGLSVVSVNSASEAAELRQHFPDITFRVLDKLTKDSRGRPLIPLQALIRTAEQVQAGICGIINSDIQFRGESAFFDRVRREVPGALVFGNRIDFEDAGFTGGKAYRFGYDFFFWERENSALFEETPMVLGLPWWDFWLPLQASGQGLSTKRFVTSAMAHVVHPTGYDIPTFLKFEHSFAATLAGVYGRWYNDRVPADRIVLHRLFATAATIPVDEDTDLARRQVMAVCNLCNCLIDTLAETVNLPDAHLAIGTRSVL